MLNFYTDDFGYNKQVDEGIIKLIESGKLFGVSVLSNMVPPDSIQDLKKVIKEKKVVVGLHINLIEGKAMSDTHEFLPFWKFFLTLLLKRINKATLEKEIKKQLSHLINTGIAVSLLDSHQHTHALSPIAEITLGIAKQESIPYMRYFGSVRSYSLKAKITYYLLKAMAFISYIAAYGKFGLPATWKKDRNFAWTIMSWESDSFDISSVQNDKSVLVIHPNLGYDSNKSYVKYIE